MDVRDRMVGVAWDAACPGGLRGMAAMAAAVSLRGCMAFSGGVAGLAGLA